MNAVLRVPPDDVPTLTEVVRPSDLAAAVEPADPPVDAERVVLRVVSHMQDLAEARLRERLPPLLEQLVSELLGGLVREFREDLLLGLHDTVRQAVAEELARTGLR
ncbi:hypothetical protein [Sphaerotilus sp.]|uniref:hypothetical protein n=1 Tax=Sphaerotilus sp. TaxID=2093942 RepID=UPI00286E4B59|nr:hypothetical protein [Sphaerotilus sp.]